MTRSRTVTAATGAALLLGMALSLPAAAEAHGRGGPRVGVFVGGFYGGWGGLYGWGPYAWGPYGWPAFGPYYGYARGVDPGMAMIAGVGAIDLNVKPGEAEVWVDGKFVAEAKDLDGYPSYLWLQRGPHHLVIYRGGYQRFEEDVDVQVAMKKDLKVRLEKGDSEPPGQRPAQTRVEGRPSTNAEPRSHERRREGGEVRLHVRPEDATVYVDGEFRGTGRELRALHLPAGRHRIELARPGFRTLEKDVEVESGHSFDLELELERP